MSEKNWIACGWYTPDYRDWFLDLEVSLITHGAPYDFQAVPKVDGGWERNTCRKAWFALDALERHSGKTVIFLDVDCLVTGDLGSLAELPCDIALHFLVSRKRRRITLVPATGHMVLNQTDKTHELISAWTMTSQNPEFGLNDQETLTLALGKVEDLNIMNIGKTARGLILHSSASAMSGIRKVNGRDRLKHALAFWR